MPEHVTGPHYDGVSGMLTFQCHKPGCEHLTRPGAEICPAFLAWLQFKGVAISEGFCPDHERCRLQPCDPPPNQLPGLQAYGRCPRDRTIHSTGEDPRPGRGGWVAEDREAPTRHGLMLRLAPTRR